MGHSYSSNLIHLVFSTRQRLDLISPDLERPLHDFIVGIGHNLKMPVVAVGGIGNHIHVLYSLPATITLAKSIQTFKANSSRFMRQHDRRFEWQQGYGAFSVSQSAKKQVITYIRNQQQHHRKLTFEEEIVVLLRKHEIAFDEQQIFA